MGKKDLKKQNKDLVIDVIDILAELDPSKTNKFLNLLLKRFKEESPHLKQYVKSELTHMIGKENLRALKDFNLHLENNRTRIKDISLLKDFSDLHEELVFAELKLKKVDLKKEITVLYKDDEWLILKPLSYEASKAYGAGTKWCTSSREDDVPFYNYSNDGIVLYVIKLGTNKKFGVHWYIEKEGGIEMSWWDVEDRKVDSLILKVPPKITQIVLDHFLNHKKNNSFYFKGRDKKRAEEIKNRENNVVPMDNFGVVGNVYDGNVDALGEATSAPPDPVWTLHEGNTTTTLNVEELVSKTMEYSYLTQSMKKSLEDLDD
tara:strand:- start:2124 stop:3077 length:954 start_codon:yes stop_codon:yes gene_type:complete